MSVSEKQSIGCNADEQIDMKNRWDQHILKEVKLQRIEGVVEANQSKQGSEPAGKEIVKEDG